MITDGWLDGVMRLPGNPEHVNGGINTLRGLVAHSAEGYAEHLLDLAVNGPLSWHMSNLKDGRLIQHFPFGAQTWHATAFNPSFVGIEHEGVAGEPLTALQITNLVLVAREIAAWRGYTRIDRLTGMDDPTAFLLAEHRQVVLFGGSATACPSGRIPWTEVLRQLEDKLTDEEKRKLDDRDGAVVEAWGRVTEWNYRVDRAAKLLIAYNPVSGVQVGTIKYEGEPPL
jgi:hypothetical protein